MNLTSKEKWTVKRWQGVKPKIIGIGLLVILLCLISPASTSQSQNIVQVRAEAQKNAVYQFPNKSMIESKQFYQQKTDLFTIRGQTNNFFREVEGLGGNRLYIAMSIGPTIRELGVVGEEKEEVITQEEEVVTKETPEVPVISSEGPGRTYYYTVTDEEKLEMAMMVYAESNSEPFRGKVAVAAVILNRLVRDQTSIHEILTAPGQFTDSSYVTMELLEKYPDNYEAVEQALKGWDPTRELFPDGAHFFYAPNGVSEEAQRARDGVPTLTIGRHNFHDEFAK
jgi:hypothetical protein